MLQVNIGLLIRAHSDQILYIDIRIKISKKEGPKTSRFVYGHHFVFTKETLNFKKKFRYRNKIWYTC